MEELIFSLITCFLHRRFFPKEEMLYQSPRHCRKLSGNSAVSCARAGRKSVNDGTVPVVSGLRPQAQVCPSAFPGALPVKPVGKMSPGAGTGYIPTVSLRCFQDAAAGQLRGARV